MWQDLLVALALVLVIEGILPFLSPSRLRNTLRTVAEFDDRTLRTIGLISMLAGVGLLYVVH
jgi:uncharacterized protein YjeT (DUF2065 family)